MELIEKIKQIYSVDDILNMFDNEILNWDFGYTPEEIEEDWENHYDFYMEFNNGEAENEVCNNILLSYGSSRNDLYHEDLLTEFEEWLTEYTMINFEV